MVDKISTADLKEIRLLEEFQRVIEKRIKPNHKTRVKHGSRKYYKIIGEAYKKVYGNSKIDGTG